MGKLELLAAWAVNSVNFYQLTFGAPMDLERLALAAVDGGGGQAADGVLLVPATLADALPPGVPAGASRELLVAHEVAHQWWGHRYAGERDRWLSESLAEYSAMMFIEASLPRGRNLMERTLADYADEVAGRASFGSGNRIGRALAIDLARDRIGPISLGRRANTYDAPRASSTLLYKKGALVLHTLRSILHASTGTAETFVELLRELADRFRGKPLSTADFERLLTEISPGDWRWFFDQWIDGTELPEIEWSGKLLPAEGGGMRVRVTATQRGVSAGFRSLLPIEVVNAEGEVRYAIADLDVPEKSFEIEVDDDLRELAVAKRLRVLGVD